ncbi:uncharacterized protein LOC111338668 [Stylophora pistillata]|uniref:uncharacterized protein LOC111338668 n=1 Tax=Stylophora pistillata TaxID=50429 RepID=UPI000C04CCAE|nr:uncharacterized protein LOC111338668 [Stylophora pistillata]
MPYIGLNESKANYRSSTLILDPRSFKKLQARTSTSSTTDDANDPDYEPNLQMGHRDDGRKERARKRKTRLERSQQRSKAKQGQSRHEAKQLEEAKTLLSLSSIRPPPLENLEEPDEMQIANQKLQEENKQIYAELVRLQEENRELKDKLKNVPSVKSLFKTMIQEQFFTLDFPITKLLIGH